MPGLPPGLKIEVGFTGAKTANSSVTWTDLTSRGMAFSTSRGRSVETDLCEPGEVGAIFENTDGLFDYDNSATYAGQVMPNRRIRISALDSGSTRRYLGYAYTNAWNRVWPGGYKFSLCEVTATDRFKLLAKRTNTGTTPQEFAHVRLKRILDAGDTDGPNCIIPTAEYSLNSDGYTTRTLVAHRYSKANTLENLREVALSDGGALFVRGDGVLVYQSTNFRVANSRSTTSNGIFGNSTVATIPLSAAHPPKIINDDVKVANTILVTDGRGKVHTVTDSTSITAHDVCELNLGATLLAATDADDRVADVLNARKNWSPRYDELVIDAYGSDAAMQQALTREISDRITVAIMPKGQTNGTRRDYYIEGIRHDVTLTSWLTTFKLSVCGTSATVITS